MAMSREELEEILFEAVGKAVKRDPATLTPDMRWVEDLSFKSVQGMKVAGLLNYKLKATVALSDLIACPTLGDGVDLLDKTVNG
jgi:hypothetical protein